MLRGSIIVFSAILSVFFLNRKLYLFHWLSIGIVVFGLSIVGYSSLLAAQHAHAATATTVATEDKTLYGT